MKLKPVKNSHPARLGNRTSWAWLCGISLAQPDAFMSMTDVEDDSDIDLVRPLDSPCNITIRRPDQEFASRMDNFNLSREARYVVGLVLETPAEAVEFLYAPINEYISRRRLLSYLRDQLGWTPRTVRSVFMELAEYVEELGE